MTRLSTAYHEAGHAVAAWRLGIRLRRVTIVPTVDAAGHVQSLGITWPKRIREALECGAMSDAQEAMAQWWAERHAVFCIAGTEAQRKFAPHSIRRHHAEDDRSSALEGIRRLVADEDLPPYWRILRNRARRLIERDWKSVRAIADALIARNTLTGEEARRIMLAADVDKRYERKTKKEAKR